MSPEAGMNLWIADSAEAADREAALRITKQVLQKPDSLIGLATGDTTAPLFDWVVKLHEQLGVDYSQVRTCNLDEYVGVAAQAPESCRFRINERLLSRINIRMENTYVPDGMAASPQKELEHFQSLVRRWGGIDFQVLGVGSNGHIAFNEPGTPFESTYRLAPISDGTKKAKAAMFGGEQNVPHTGISMGIRDIMMARRILLVAKGKHKAAAIRSAVHGPLTTEAPASILMMHPCVDVVIDREAASML